MLGKYCPNPLRGRGRLFYLRSLQESAATNPRAGALSRPSPALGTEGRPCPSAGTLDRGPPVGGDLIPQPAWGGLPRCLHGVPEGAGQVKGPGDGL